jgi:hypothetical protein
MTVLALARASNKLRFGKEEGGCRIEEFTVQIHGEKYITMEADNNMGEE